MAADLHISIHGLLGALRMLQMLQLPPNKRRQLHRALVRKVSSYSKKRISRQQTLEGSPFTPRKGKGKGKMLKGLRSRIKVAADPNEGKLYWVGGRVAFAHQHGYSEDWTPAKMRQRAGEGNRSLQSPATRQQARKLRELGYKRRRGKGWVQPNLKWIQANMSIAQAGLIIRILGDAPKTHWRTVLPSRAFLGATIIEQAEMVDVLASQIIRYR